MGKVRAVGGIIQYLQRAKGLSKLFDDWNRIHMKGSGL
jgi:hypothetical protein